MQHKTTNILVPWHLSMHSIDHFDMHSTDHLTIHSSEAMCIGPFFFESQTGLVGPVKG